MPPISICNGYVIDRRGVHKTRATLYFCRHNISTNIHGIYPATGKTHYGPKYMNYLDVTATKSIHDISISNAKLDEAKILLRSLK